MNFHHIEYDQSGPFFHYPLIRRITFGVFEKFWIEKSDWLFSPPSHLGQKRGIYFEEITCFVILKVDARLLRRGLTPRLAKGCVAIQRFEMVPMEGCRLFFDKFAAVV